MDKKYLCPVVKFRSALTYPDKSQAIPAVVVKMQDFLRENGTPKVSAIRRVECLGGLHEVLDYSGRVILSPIMPDSILMKINFETYAYLIETLQPDQYITPDCTTYTGFAEDSRNQIDHILEITIKLLDRFVDSAPIGLIKGSNLSQIDFHLENLLELGVNQFCLHAGDFLYKGSKHSKNQIIDFARYVREKVPYLMIYGVGSKHYFQRFNCADVYVTNSHFMQAFNHRVICGATWRNFKGKPTKEIVMRNFEYLRRIVEGQRNQWDLTTWMPNKIAIEMNGPYGDNAALENAKISVLEG